MSSRRDRVTVLMSVHDGERFLSEAIESILGQTFPDFEFLIVDDGSEDDTWKILTRYAAQDDRVRLIKNDRRLGLAKSLNKGLAQAKGEYIARMDADDVSLMDRLSSQVSFLDSHPDVGVAGTAVQLIDDTGTVDQPVEFPEEHGVLKWQLCFFYNPFAHPSVMMRSQALMLTGTYDETLATSQDYDLWCRMSGTTRLSNLSEILVLLRKHSASISSIGFLDQQKNALTIGGKLIRETAGQRLRTENILSLWKFTFYPGTATPADIRRASKLTYRIASRTLNNDSLSPLERKKIKEDALRRLNILLQNDNCTLPCRWRVLLNTYLIGKS